MNLQHWIDQHPSVFAAVFPIYFLSFWVLVGTIISFIGGWSSLAIGVSPQGLYLASLFLFRFMHPALLVPWSEIKVRRSKGWFFEYVIFTMGHDLAIPLRIRAKLAAKLQESAGTYWPVEET